MLKTIVAATLLVLAIPNVKSAQTQIRSPDGKTRVNVYRYKQAYGMALRPSIYCDGKDIARLQNGRSVVLALAPGKHVFRSNDKQSQIDLDLKPDQEYYIRIDLAKLAVGLVKAHGRLTLVQAEQGAAEFKQMKAIDVNMVKDAGFLAPEFVPER